AECAADVAATLNTLTDDIVYEIVPLNRVMHGREEVARYYREWWSGLRLLEVNILRHWTAGDVVFLEVETVSKHVGPFLGLAPSGRIFRQRILAILTVRDGKIAEEI